jgi:radical SAM superfamily enzyme YgiQ (UPF0313 family)
MKLCLISSPTVTEYGNEAIKSADVRLSAEHAPIGILSLAAVVEGLGFTPQIVDLNRLYYDFLRSEGRREEREFCTFVASHLESFDCDIYGLSTICSTYPLTLRVAGEIKRRRPCSTVVLGGPQASVVDVQTLVAFPSVDFVVRGEAEETLPILLDALSGANGFEGIRGITFRRGDSVVRNPNAPVIHDLDRLPLPAFHLYPYMEDSRQTQLELGRGCPFDCSFCSTNDFFRRQFRLKSPQRVIEQMKFIKSTYGIDTFELIHDMFTVDRKRVLAFCEALEQSGDEFFWGCSARTDCVDDKLLEKMSRAGCTSIFFGIETGSGRLQRVIKKRLNLSEANSRIKTADRCGISTTVSLITGFPDETKEDLRETVNFLADSLRFELIEPQLHLLAPLAQTPIASDYKDDLVFDDVVSDLSYEGWQQDPADWTLIKAHPEIFTNFYALPTPWLDRQYLKELREFLLQGIRWFRWLLVTLHQDTGDLLKVFDAWKVWHDEREAKVLETGPKGYYSLAQFRVDFLDFVRSHYLNAMCRTPLVVLALVEYETALSRLSGESSVELCESTCELSGDDNSLGRETTLSPAKGVYLIVAPLNYKDLFRCLRRKGRLDRVPSQSIPVVFRKTGGTVDTLQLNWLSAQLLRLCDGTRPVREIIGRFCSTMGHVDGIPGDEACLIGLEALRKQGLIASSELDYQDR